MRHLRLKWHSLFDFIAYRAYFSNSEFVLMVRKTNDIVEEFNFEHQNLCGDLTNLIKIIRSHIGHGSYAQVFHFNLHMKRMRPLNTLLSLTPVCVSHAFLRLLMHLHEKALRGGCEIFFSCSAKGWRSLSRQSYLVVAKVCFEIAFIEPRFYVM